MIQSIQRAVNIINCFDENELELSLNKISELLNLNINTTRGIVNTLVGTDLLRHNPNNTYSLSIFFLQKASLINKTIIGLAKEASFAFLEEIAEKYRVSSRLLVASSRGIDTLIIVNPKNSHYLLTNSHETPMPLHAMASGKMFLAYNRKLLETVRFFPFTENTAASEAELSPQLEAILRDGYSSEIEELGTGISSVAVPILTKEKTLFGAISITTLTPLLDTIRQDVIPEMQQYAQALSDILFADMHFPATHDSGAKTSPA